MSRGGHAKQASSRSRPGEASPCIAPCHARPEPFHLVGRVVARVTGNPCYVFFATLGAKTVESAVGMVRQYQNARGTPHKTRLIAGEGVYYGSGLMATTLTGREGPDIPFDIVARVALPTFPARGRARRDHARFLKAPGARP